MRSRRTSPRCTSSATPTARSAASTPQSPSTSTTSSSARGESRTAEQAMSVVRVPPVLREEAGGAREVEASGATVRELLEGLSQRLPALGNRVYDGSGIRSYVNVYVDGGDVRTRGGLDAPVREGA